MEYNKIDQPTQLHTGEVKVFYEKPSLAKIEVYFFLTYFYVGFS